MFGLSSCTTSILLIAALFLLAGFLFVIVGLLFARTRYQVPREEGGERDLMREFFEGAGYILSNRVVGSIVLMAGLLGMLPETFSRALAKLASQGAIRVNRKQIQVIDAARLLDEAGG